MFRNPAHPHNPWSKAPIPIPLHNHSKCMLLLCPLRNNLNTSNTNSRPSRVTTILRRSIYLPQNVKGLTVQIPIIGNIKVSNIINNLPNPSSNPLRLLNIQVDFRGPIVVSFHLAPEVETADRPMGLEVEEEVTQADVVDAVARLQATEGAD